MKTNAQLPALKETETRNRSKTSKVVVESGGICGFNYGALDDDARDLAERAAGNIKSMQTSIARTVVDIGRELLAVQRALGPKLFAAWREAELSMSQSVVANYCAAAKTFSNDAPLESFSAAALFELSREKVSNAVREQAIERANRGEKITTTVVSQLIAEHAIANADVEAVDPTPASKAVNDARSSIRMAIRAWPVDAQQLVAVRMAAALRQTFAELGFAEAFDQAAARSTRAAPRGAVLGVAARATSLAIGAPVLT